MDFNPIALRKAKIIYYFGLSECNRVNQKTGLRVCANSRQPQSHHLDDSRVRAYCACSRCGSGLFGHFFSHLSFLFFSFFFFSLGEDID